MQVYLSVQNKVLMTSLTDVPFIYSQVAGKTQRILGRNRSRPQTKRFDRLEASPQPLLQRPRTRSVVGIRFKTTFDGRLAGLADHRESAGNVLLLLLLWQRRNRFTWKKLHSLKPVFVFPYLLIFLWNEIPRKIYIMQILNCRLDLNSNLSARIPIQLFDVTLQKSEII